MGLNGTVFGYRLQDGKYIVKPDEAEVVKQIFTWYLAGMGYMAIAKKLNASGVKTRNGNAWNHASVLWILHNYSYTGNLLLQTTYTESHITKKYRKNTGEKPMFPLSSPVQMRPVIYNVLAASADVDFETGHKQTTSDHNTHKSICFRQYFYSQL